MEQSFPLDWAEIVSETKRRRKELRLTQKELAVVANISGPTVTRFERQEENITLESVLAILRSLGMVKKSTLPERFKGEAIK